MGVDRCVCKDLTFTALKESAHAGGGLSYEELAAATGCGEGCGLCIPYIRLMLRTGVTHLPVLTDEQLARMVVGDTAGPGRG